MKRDGPVLETEKLRLECLKLVWPKDMADADSQFYIGKADALFSYVQNGVSTPKRRGRPPKADKPQGPAQSV